MPAFTGTAKGYVVGTHRVVAPAAFLPRIQPLLPVAGVTRLANITGLDRIGIPVVSAIRPAGLTLSSASGKGLTLEAAMVSAAMEAIEVFAAETAQLAELYCTSGELDTRTRTVPLDALPLRRHAIVTPWLPLRWTLGVDLMSGAETAVPVNLVTLAGPAGPLSPFAQTSNGLASGAVRAEAVLAALYEVVERDAVGCWQLAARKSGCGLRRVRVETLHGMACVQELLERFQAARVEPIVYDCTIGTAIPTYFARLVDLTNRHVGVFFGSGAHLDPEIAVVRALTEAAQSRAVYLAGSRDDVLSRELAQVQAQDSPSVVDALLRHEASVDASLAHSMVAETFEADIRCVLAGLAASGIEQVVVVDLTAAAFRDAVSVVRVVIPGFAGPNSQTDVAPARAAAIARRLAA